MTVKNKTVGKNYKSDELLTATITQTEFGKLIGLSQARVNQLVDEQILVRDPTSRSGRLMLIASLRNYDLSKKSTDEGVNYWVEKARHEKVKRELSELKLRQAAGELYEASIVEAVLIEILTDFRNKLLGIGHKLALRLENKTASAICAAIDAEIIDNLEEISKSLEDEKWTDIEGTDEPRDETAPSNDG